MHRMREDSGIGSRPPHSLQGWSLPGRGSRAPPTHQETTSIDAPWPPLCSNSSRFLKLLLEQLPVYLPISTLDCELQGAGLAHSWRLLDV